jgi:transcriptional regulator with XRE-family HTH domain
MMNNCPMESLKDRINEVMQACGWTSDAQVAALAGVSRSAVAQWRGKGSKEIKSIDLAPAMRLQAASGFGAQWISSGTGPKRVQATPDAQDHPMNEGAPNSRTLDIHTVNPPIEWEDLMKNKDTWADGSMVRLPDDALAPELRRGDWVRLQRGVTPRAGDYVLVSDASGNWLVRLYQERRPGDWSAAATNPAYGSLHVESDGLAVLAVAMEWARVSTRAAP